MTAHEQFAEDLALHALGSLQGEERAALERHLEDCAACRGELERLQGDLALLAWSVAGPSPPQRARQKLLSAIAREPHPRAVPMRRPWWTLAPVFATVVLALFAILLLRENLQQRQRIEALQAEAARGQASLERARQVLAVLTAQDAVHITLVAAQAQPQPQGKAIYLPRMGCLVFMASNLAPLPPQRTYELWLVPAKGGAPMQAGMFKPDARGSAMVMMPPLPAGVEAKAFAVTIEPEGGATTPTMPMVLVGAGQ